MKLESSTKVDDVTKADMFHVLSKLVNIQWNNLQLLNDFSSLWA